MAKTIILKDRGTQFDPDLVDAFLATEAKFLEIQRRYADISIQHSAVAA
jgi:response regulator RpfG family c-di-GMP phosphodiesterase